MTPQTKTSNLARLGLAITCLLVLSACGGDDDTEAVSGSDVSVPETTELPPPTSAAPTTAATPTGTEAADTAVPATSAAIASGTEPALCDPYLQVSAAFAGEPDPGTIGGLLDQVDAAAPTDIAEQLAILTDGGRTVLETGDFSVFERPDFAAAITAADTWVFENCEFVTTTEIVATEYQYAGPAAVYPAGRTAFMLVNDGAEAHELAIIRKNDDVDLTLDELMLLPEAEAEQMTSFVAAAFVGPTGARSNLVVDLAPGSYIAVCNVPAGTIVADDGSFTEGTGQAHVMLGMSFEFSVS